MSFFADSENRRTEYRLNVLREAAVEKICAKPSGPEMKAALTNVKSMLQRLVELHRADGEYVHKGTLLPWPRQPTVVLL